MGGLGVSHVASQGDAAIRAKASELYLARIRLAQC
jgi:hypothetical protein